MRKRYLVLMLLCCFALASCVLACSDGGSTASTEDDANPIQGDTTSTTTESTTTTLAPATWESVTPAGDIPPARLGGSMVYLADGDRLVLFGGYDGTVFYNDLWTYDLDAGVWAQLGSAGSAPAERASHAMAYDPAADRLIVFGGYDGTTCYKDMWAYNLAGDSWSLLVAGGAVPHERYGHSLVYDPGYERMLLFGGYDGTSVYADTWSYDPATNVWTDLEPGGTLPTARDSQALAYDSDNDVFVMFGGWSTTTVFDDTWAYDPATNVWTPLMPVSGSPAARALHQMVYDSSIKKFVLFGGGTSTSTFNDAWLFDLAEDVWTPVEAGGEPPTVRAGLAMVYDTSDRQVLLFGGTNGIDSYLSDLWRLRR